MTRVPSRLLSTLAGGGLVAMAMASQFASPTAPPRVATPQATPAALATPEHLRGFEDLPGDPARGRTVFDEVAGCIACHATAPGVSSDGPNLAGVATRLTSPQLVLAILNPSAETPPEFRTLTVTDANGKTFRGAQIPGGGEGVLRHAAGHEAAEACLGDPERLGNRTHLEIVGDEKVTERLIAEELLKTIPVVDEDEEEEAVTA